MSIESRSGQTTSAMAEWWRGAAIYQIYPRSYFDANGDGIGDLAGITAKLDYVASLGVDAVWVSPFFKSPMKDFGYDVSDYCDVDPIFGSLADFDKLVARAHELGLKVLVDQVYSHTSDQHPWFQESRQNRTNPKADWYVWVDAKPDGSPPNNWQSVFGGPAWTWDARRGQYYLHNFLSSQPDLNMHNPEVQDAVLNAARFWLERGVDGLRLDAIHTSMHDPALRDNPPAAPGGKRTRPFDFQYPLYNQSHPDIPRFIERIRALMEEFGGRFALAEVNGARGLEEMKEYTAGKSRFHSAYGFDFLYAERLTAELVRETIRQWPGVDGEGWPSWALSNHDAPRFASRWAYGRSPDLVARVGLLLLTALRGSIIIYQGEELGLPQADVPFEKLQDPEAIANWPQTLGRDGARTPLPWTDEAPHGGFTKGEPWLPVDAHHLPLAIARQDSDPSSVLNETRRLMALRRSRPVLRTGKIALLDSPHDLLVFERGEGDDRLLCVFNFGSEPIIWQAEGWRAVAAAGGADPAEAQVPPFSGYIAERAHS